MADLVSTIRDGDRAATLLELAVELAESFAAAEHSNKAQLAKQLRETLVELDAIEDVTEVDELDELAARRPTEAKVPARAAGGSKRR